MPSDQGLIAGFADLVDDLLGTSGKKDEPAEDIAAPTTSALDLVIADDVDGLAQLLKDDRDFPLNARSPQTGRSLLHEACARGQKEIVKLLLQSMEADLMLRTMLGRCTPLHLAVANNHRSIVFLLLSHGADVSSRDRFSCSPLHYAKSLSVAKLLIQYGAKVLDFNAKKKHAGDSAAKFAATYQKDHSVSSPERVAAIASHSALVKYLEKEAKAEYKAKLQSLQQNRQAKQKSVAVRSSRKARKI